LKLATRTVFAGRAGAVGGAAALIGPRSMLLAGPPGCGMTL
jgi:SpoVK/Ycf46/Vps4 family AAA+-type ATPase